MVRTLITLVAVAVLVESHDGFAQPAPPTQPVEPAPAPDTPEPTPPPAPPGPTEPPGPTAPEPAAQLTPAPAQAIESDNGASFEVYGFVMLDSGYDFGKIGDPAWFDTVRPSKLPAFEDEFGKGGRTFAGVRQTRFGVKSTLPTKVGDIKSQFEWELFGVGVDAGQTTIRLRHAYGDWKQFRAGQTWSPFMDIDVFPNSIEYWGPNGMPFFRNVQVAWMPIQGDSRVTVALERPGASADTTNFADRIELENVVPRFPLPDLSAEARHDDPGRLRRGLRHRSLHEVGRSRPDAAAVRRRCGRLGPPPQLEPQGRARSRQAVGGLRAGDLELHERCNVRRRPRTDG